MAFGHFYSIAPTFGNPEFKAKSRQLLLGALTVPDLKILMEILIGHQRGVFRISPVLILATLGFLGWLKDRRACPEGIIAIWAVVSFLAFNASFNGWHGGNSSGPRYLIPMLPFWLLGLYWVRSGIVFYVLLAVSIFNATAITATTVNADPWSHLFSGVIYAKIRSGERYWHFLAYCALTLSLTIVTFKLLQKNKDDKNQLASLNN
ncbi:MAG: hypothetical protein A3K03_04335 [Bdellovibrionales bacterium RIFOXYD1_FULL_44_7]|nr:MAG: hypothetical protein A3K03_04335 [Bdellovibrionales bacterium RIFOXYD1_FULL_44_7]